MYKDNQIIGITQIFNMQIFNKLNHFSRITTLFALTVL